MKGIQKVKRIEQWIPPEDLFPSIRNAPFSFFLDSSLEVPEVGRFSFMGANPVAVFSAKGDSIVITGSDGVERKKGDPLLELANFLRPFALRRTSHVDIPFTGGGVGFISYDLSRRLEKTGSHAVEDLYSPDICLAIYPEVIAYDLHSRKMFLVSTKFAGDPEASLIDLLESDGAIRASLESNFPSDYPSCEGLRSNFEYSRYLDAIEMAKEYIAQGDIFQVNLSQRFEAKLRGDSYSLYLKLRKNSPAPFSCFLNFGDITIASSSPERFLRVKEREVETRPIKGTRPRGRTPLEDENLAKELLLSEKDRAENVMILDLERNDLGRVCEFGSVRVKTLCALKSYASVHHLESTVVGRLRDHVGIDGLIRATFPSGSISGAPKVRAMEIIDELEPHRRGIYSGSIGYVGFDGRVDLNIAIRTFVLKDGICYFHVGGGIVADSNPEDEYLETLHKAKGLLTSLGFEGQALMVEFQT